MNATAEQLQAQIKKLKDKIERINEMPPTESTKEALNRANTGIAIYQSQLRKLTPTETKK